jgi:hypothetical protein
LVVSSAVGQQVVFHPNEKQQPTELDSPPFTRIVGKLSCSAPNLSGFVRNALQMLPIKINGIGVITDATTGTFNVSGSFTGTVVHLEVNYDGHIMSTVNASTISTRLQVMDEGHSTRTHSADLSGTARGTTIDLSAATLSTVDCEIWRIGTTVLKDYHS